MKRAFIIAASIIVVIGIGIAIYFLFFTKNGTLTVGSNPFGDLGSGTAGTGSEILGSGAGTEVAPHLIKITDGPVAAGTIALSITRPADTNTNVATTSTTVPDVEVRYVDRASGNIFSFIAHSRTLARLSNKTLPGIQEASWLPNGSMAYVRFVSRDTATSEHIGTYALPVTGGDGYFLEEDLAQANAAGSTTIFSLLTSTTGSVGTVARSDGTNARTLFTSLLSSIIVTPSNSGFFAHTRASSQMDGYGFSIAANGTFTRLLGPLRGLTLLPSPSGKNILYSYVDGGTPRLAVMDTASHAATALPLTTLTEKCVWGSDNLTIYCGVPTNLSGALPDDWYQGAVSFSDRIWRIDLTGRVATLVVDPKQVGKVSIDATALSLDPKLDILTFTDKSTGALWMYDL